MNATGMSPEAIDRLNNLAKHWNPRIEAAKTDADLAKTMFDRAKAAAKRAQKSGDHTAMHELAQSLAAWSAEMEKRDALRETRNAA